MTIVKFSPQYYPDPTKGKPVSSGSIFVGIVDLDPEIEANQKQLSVQQENGDIVQISQPVLTGAGGSPIYQGSTVTLLVNGAYSLKVLDSSGSQVYYIPNNNENSSDTLETIEDLRELSGSFENQSVHVLGYYEAGDGGGGPLRIWKEGQSPGFYVDNGGSIIVPNGGDGSAAWLWEYSGPLNIRWFGAKGDGVTDDTAVINTTIEVAGVVTETTRITTVDLVTNSVFAPAGTYAVTTIEILTGVNFYGSGNSTAFKQLSGDVLSLNSAGGFAYNVKISDFMLIDDGNKTGKGIIADSLIRSCKISNVTIDGFEYGAHIVSSQTLTLDGCQFTNAGENNLFVSGMTNGYILNSRFDVSGSHSVVINNSVLDSENLTIKSSAFQSADLAGLYTSNINNIIIEGCFFEANDQTGTNAYASLHVEGDDTGSITIREPYITLGSGGVGLAAIYIENYRTVEISSPRIQSFTTGISLETIESVTMIEGLIGATGNEVVTSNVNFFTKDAGNAPLQIYGKDMNQGGSFDGISDSAMLAGVEGAGYVAMGSYNDRPALQGGGAGSGFELTLSPFSGLTKIFGLQVKTAETSSNYVFDTGDEREVAVIINTSGGNRAVTIPAAEDNQGRVLIISKSTGDANNLIITPTAGTIQGAANKTTGTAYASLVLLASSLNDWAIISEV